MMNIRKIITLSMTAILLTGCASQKTEKPSVSATQKPAKTDNPSPSPSTKALSTDHTILADKTLSIDYDLLENIPLNGSEAKAYIEKSSYANDLNSQFYSPDPNGFEVTVTDQNYAWLSENYSFDSSTSDPYLNNSTGYMTLNISGESEYENSDGYYPDTTDALKKNLTAAGYKSQGDHPGNEDDTGYQVNYYVYSKGKRTFSICEILLNGKLSTSVLEVGEPA